MIGRRWFLAHWFLGVFTIIGVVWVMTLVAYALGAGGISFGNKYTGQEATIDFMRQYDRPVVGLGDGVGLELDTGGPALHGTIVRLERGLPGFCWVCGYHEVHGGMGMADYRDGDWFYRAPAEQSWDVAIAYNRATGERVMVGERAGLVVEEQALAAKGLVISDEHRLRPEAIGDLPVVSMMREGCVIFNAAFVAVVLLWFVLGGLAVIVVRLVRRRRA